MGIRQSIQHTAIVLLLVNSGSVITAGALQITSSSFKHNGVMPEEFTCDGAGTSPDLQFDGSPPGTRSLVLIVVDEDVAASVAPDGRYLHWALWDLSANRKELVKGQRARGINHNGPGPYLPACPTNWEHRYRFQLYALNKVIGGANISNEADLRQAMDGHILEQAELVGRYTTSSFRRTRAVMVVIAVTIGLIVGYRTWSSRRARTA